MNTKNKPEMVACAGGAACWHTAFKRCDNRPAYCGACNARRSVALATHLADKLVGVVRDQAFELLYDANAAFDGARRFADYRQASDLAGRVIGLVRAFEHQTQVGLARRLFSEFGKLSLLTRIELLQVMASLGAMPEGEFGWLSEADWKRVSSKLDHFQIGRVSERIEGYVHQSRQPRSVNSFDQMPSKHYGKNAAKREADRMLRQKMRGAGKGGS